ncbi:MAG TPA: hypothetical protein VI791_03035 [Patescibacteria group bacterium]|nr:hypothetical protein [Patescibacteria group bacterium]
MKNKKDQAFVGYLSGSLSFRCDSPLDLFLIEILTEITKIVKKTSNQVLYIKSKQEGAGFTVAINQPLTVNVTFNYWLIQTQP